MSMSITGRAPLLPGHLAKNPPATKSCTPKIIPLVKALFHCIGSSFQSRRPPLEKPPAIEFLRTAPDAYWDPTDIVTVDFSEIL